MPEVGFYDSPEVNAFATGPSKRKSLVAVSSGLLRTMRHEEVEGVLAHEVVAHSERRHGHDDAHSGCRQRVCDVLRASSPRSASAGDDSRNAYMLSFVVMIVLDIVLGILGMMVVAWFSRAREFRADAGGAALAGRGT